MNIVVKEGYATNSIVSIYPQAFLAVYEKSCDMVQLYTVWHIRKCIIVLTTIANSTVKSNLPSRAEIVSQTNFSLYL